MYDTTDVHGLESSRVRVSSQEMTATSRLRWSGRVYVVCGLWLVVLGIYFLFLRPALLPEDLRYIGSSLEAIRSAVPDLARSSWTTVFR